nr:Histone-lysine N-methyltransferase CLF [Ipomoea batatas]
MVPAAKNTVDVQRLARIDSEVVIVPKVSVEAVNVLVLLQAGNAILMFAEIAGLAVVMGLLGFLYKGVIIMNVGI